MEKLKVVRFIPSIVVRFVTGGSLHLQSSKPFIVTSTCIYDDMESANDGLESLIDLYKEDNNYEIMRSRVAKINIKL